MTNDSCPNLPPFPSSYGASGLLLHVTYLLSHYGIGDVGPIAIAWNIPGRADDNWSWRSTEELLSATDFNTLQHLTRSSNRLPMTPKPAIEMVEASLPTSTHAF